MTDEEHKELIADIFSKFRQLPTLRSQIDLLGALTGKLKDRPKYALFREWMDDAKDGLSQAARFMRNDDEKDGQKL